MKNTIKILLIAAIAVLSSCSDPEQEAKNTKLIPFTFESEALDMAKNTCANGSILVELVGESVSENKPIATFPFKCNTTGKVTVNVPVDSYIRISFDTVNPVEEFLTTNGLFRTHSEGAIVIKVEEE